MTLDELVGSLRTYEMNMDVLKKVEVFNDKSLGLKVSDGEESDLDEDQIAFLAKSFKKYIKKGKGVDKKETSNKKWSNEKSFSGCYKCGKANHHVKVCPQ